MKKWAVALVLLATIPAVGLVGWIASGWYARSEEAPSEATGPEVLAVPVTEDVELAPAPVPTRVPAPVPVPVPESSAEATPPAPGFTPPEGSIWIEGRVLLPPDTPEDEVLRVTAKGREFAGGHGRTHTVVVASDGSFRVAVAEGSTRAWLSLEARYLFLKRTAGVDLRSAPRAVELEPELGGRIAGP